ncbi:MAG: hypothetical protein FWH29_08795 [Methanobrevibacter sp.]|nr:hypothetical protein [Methanobrevibacter sp.]
MRFKKIEGKKIHVRESNKGWTIIILPNYIKIDCYQGFTNIRFKSGGISIPVIYDNLEMIIAIIKKHIISYRTINNLILIKKLIGALND